MGHITVSEISCGTHGSHLFSNSFLVEINGPHGSSIFDLQRVFAEKGYGPDTLEKLAQSEKIFIKINDIEAFAGVASITKPENLKICLIVPESFRSAATTFESILKIKGIESVCTQPVKLLGHEGHHDYGYSLSQEMDPFGKDIQPLDIWLSNLTGNPIVHASRNGVTTAVRSGGETILGQHDSNIVGGSGPDIIVGGQQVSGGSGNDVFQISGNGKKIEGGSGDDTFYLRDYLSHRSPPPEVLINHFSGGPGADTFVVTHARQGEDSQLHQHIQDSHDSNTLIVLRDEGWLPRKYINPIIVNPPETGGLPPAIEYGSQKLVLDVVGCTVIQGADGSTSSKVFDLEVDAPRFFEATGYGAVDNDGDHKITKLTNFCTVPVSQDYTLNIDQFVLTLDYSVTPKITEGVYFSNVLTKFFPLVNGNLQLLTGPYPEKMRVEALCVRVISVDYSDEEHRVHQKPVIFTTASANSRPLSPSEQEEYGQYSQKNIVLTFYKNEIQEAGLHIERVIDWEGKYLCSKEITVNLELAAYVRPEGQAKGFVTPYTPVAIHIDRMS